MTKYFVWALSVSAVVLLIVSFIVPPTGVIDGSVLAGSGVIFGFSALLTGLVAFEKGRDVKVTHGSTTIEANSDDDTD